MIPQFVDIGASWMVLPPGVHDATFQEVSERFAYNERRRILYAGLLEGCKSLEAAGCGIVYLDGSFVTDKPTPGDFDVCWNPMNVDHEKLDPVLLDFKDGRRNQKLKFGGEFFLSSALADGSLPFLIYFQRDKETESEKGLIRLHLRDI